MKRNYHFKDALAETLLIPLYMRAKDYRNGDYSILNDQWADKLVNIVNFDFSIYNHAKMNEMGCIVRTWYFDHIIRQYIASRRHPVVINIGCGLDARAQRIGDDGKTIFYEVDLPEVIDLRNDIFPAASNDRYVKGSILDTDWMEIIRNENPEGQFILVIEGVLMFFTEETVKTFLSNLAKHFPGSEVWFDICGNLMYKQHITPSSLKQHEAEIRFGLSNGKTIEQWIPSLSLIKQVHYMKFFRNRWGIFLGHFIGRIPKLCYQFSSMVGYRIN